MTGTVILEIAARITLLAGRAASSVGRSRMTHPVEADAIVICLEAAEVVLGSAPAVVVVAAAQVGSPVTGFAAGPGATSTTLLVVWNVSDAMPPRNMVASRPINSSYILHFWVLLLYGKTEKEKEKEKEN